MNRGFIVAVVALSVLFVSQTPAQAQLTTITYQGQLEQNGSPVDGQIVELHFELRDDPDPDSGTAVSIAGPFDVLVEDGLFQAELNFGDVNYTVAKYLRIRVDGTWLDGTQEITSVPMAQYALGAGGVQWSGVRNAPEFWRLGGNAGTSPGSDFIGTTDNKAFEVQVNGARALRIEPGDGPNIIAGSPANQVKDGAVGASVAGGAVIDGNIVTDHFGTVAGGAANTAGSDDGDPTSDRWAFVGGGEDNTASGPRSTVGGGHRNEASGLNAVVGGGNSNTASNSYSTIAGGDAGTVDGFYGALGGGSNNSVFARFGAIGGGGWTDSANRDATSNRVHDQYGTIAGGGNNQAGADDGNTSAQQFATIGGGEFNTATGRHSTVGGGNSNTASDAASTVGGGSGNTADNISSTVGGGSGNTASKSRSTVGGGFSNTASRVGSTVGGGLSNTASGFASTVGGGDGNNASGDYATVPGGEGARATRYGEQAYASGYFTQPGDAQASTLVLRNTTSDTAWTELFLDGASERLEIEAGRTLAFEVLIIGRDIDSSTAHAWKGRGLIFTNSSGTNTQFWGNPNSGVIDIDGDAAWDVRFRADDAANALLIEVSGALNTDIRWVARVETVEVAAP